MKYASESEVEYQLGLGWDSFFEGMSFTVPAGKTDWTLSEILPVDEAFVTSVASKRAIASTSALADTYVADMVFFANKGDAYKYIEQWNAYYAGQYNAEPCECLACWLKEHVEGGFTVHTFTGDTFGGKPYGYDTATCAVEAEYVNHHGVDCIKPGRNNSWACRKASDGYGYGSCISGLDQGNHNAAYRKYAVLTYASDSEYPMVFSMTWGKDSGFVGAEPNPDGWMSVVFEIEEGSAMRESDRNRTMISAKTPFYLRELVFFENEADAKAYAVHAPAHYNGEIVDEAAPVAPTHPTNFQDGIWTSYRFSANNEAVSGVGTFKLDGNGIHTGANKYTYVDNGIYYVSAYNSPDSWVPVNGSTTNRKGFGIRFNNINGAFTVKENNVDVIKPAYLVAIVRSDSASDQTINAYTVGHGNKAIGTIPAYTTGWVATSPIDITTVCFDNTTKTLYSGFVARETVIYTTATDTDALDIAELAFFKTEEAANAYAAAAEEYYKAITCLDPLENLKYNSEGQMLTLAFTEGNYNVSGAATDTSKHTATTYKGVECVEVGYGAKEWPGSTNYRFGYGANTTFQNKIKVLEYSYAVAVYATNSKSESQLRLQHWGTVDSGNSLLTSNITISDGNWVASDIVAVDEAWRNRAGSNTNIIYTGGTAEGEELYLREIVYFTNEDDAKLYQSLAPEYYNSFNGN